MSLNSSAVLTKILPLLSARSKLCRGRARNPWCVCTALASLLSLSLRWFHLRVPLVGSRRDAATRNHLVHPGFYPTITSAAAEAGPDATPLPPKAPYLSRQVMGSAAKPRHMLRAGHPGIQQLIGSSRGCQGLQEAAAGTTCPAVPGWRLR